MKRKLGVSDALYLQPLLYGLGTKDSDFELLVNLPAHNALKFRERTDHLQCAFLSPIDYARYGSEYRIVPDVGVSSSVPTDTIQLFVKSSARNISTVAVDIRVTSEIILAKIILLEKFPNFTAGDTTMQFLPMLPNLDQMLAKADAALIVNFTPNVHLSQETFALDLAEEWNDLTDLPYVHGFWVGREEDAGIEIAQRLIRAKTLGVSHTDHIAGQVSQHKGLSLEEARNYLARFSYDFGTDQEESLSEFMRYAFYHGVIPDVPDINFFEFDSPSLQSLN
ncbi:MAG: hypothetical protein HY088_07280 [Ignavibacteriales bacterium]|nr:hypothetical protein [Ignavibacteriales bacterium]